MKSILAAFLGVEDEPITPGPPLPDELVKRILGHLFIIPERLFSDAEKISPFAAPSRSNSDFLLVSKQWMRVATPLLYETVILRSKAQAQALERTLKENRDFGRYVRKMRLEGGFGASVFKIFQVVAPNVTHLCLSLELWSDDNVAGLIKALALVQPRYVALRAGVDEKSQPMVNKCTKALMAAVCACIRDKWRAMETFYFPYHHHNTRFGELAFSEDLVLSLAASPSLNTLEVPHQFQALDLHNIAKNENLKRILVRSPPPKIRQAQDPFLSYNPEDLDEETTDYWANILGGERRENKAVRANERLRSLVIHEDKIPSYIATPPSQLAKSSNPFYAPMSDASPEIKEKIWTKIIYFATKADYRPEPPSYANRHSWKKSLVMTEKGKVIPSNKNRLAIASVCKQFWRLTESHLYQYPELGTIDAIHAFAVLIKSKPALASHIRTLTFRRAFNVPENASIYDRESLDPRFIDSDRALHFILSTAKNLVAIKQASEDNVSGMDIRNSLPWNVLECLPEKTIERMEGICFAAPSLRDRFLVLGRFSKLVHLDIEIMIEGDRQRGNNDDGEGPEPISANQNGAYCLPMLDKLSYAETTEDHWQYRRSEWAGKGLLGVLAVFKLPKLHALDLRSRICDESGLTAFLRSHGSKFRVANLASSQFDDVEFLNHCYNVETLGLGDYEPPHKSFFSHYEFGRTNRLSVVIAKGESPAAPASCNKYTAQRWLEYFKGVSLGCMQSLVEFRVEACIWPTTEREVLKGDNIWIECSTCLMERYDVRLTDANGKYWIPRLAAVTAGARETLKKPVEPEERDVETEKLLALLMS